MHEDKRVTLECHAGSMIISASKNGRTIRVGQMVQINHADVKMRRPGIVVKIHLPMGKYSFEFISVHFECDLWSSEVEFEKLI